MRLAILVAMLAVACGGSDKPAFKGDEVVAELRSGVPFCSPGSTGPSIATRTATTKDDNGNPYQSTVVECDWTCGNINGLERYFVYVVFFTGPDGAWSIDPHADPDRAKCPTD